jgi:two-component system, response regulator RegA
MCARDASACRVLRHPNRETRLAVVRWKGAKFYFDAMGSSRPIRSVLVVDDDETILASWRRGAGSERTVWAATCADAARAIFQQQTLDLAIVDLRIGDESGIALVRELRDNAPELPIALCSGYLSVDVAVAAVRAGADIIAFKPITFREILQRLDEGEIEPDLDETPSLARAEWEHIMRVLSDCDGNVSAAARRLGIYRSSLQRRLRKYAPRD